MEDKQWNNLCMLTEVSEPLKDITENLVDDSASWESFIRLENIHEARGPEYYSTLPTFTKALIIKAVRPEKIVFVMRNYIIDKLGSLFANPPPINLKDI